LLTTVTDINFGLGRHIDTLDKETIPKYIRVGF